MSSLVTLESVRIAAPCRASWERMVGDERVRFCAECQKNVYNLSAISRKEAEALVREREGRLCARFYRRADGTIMTRNCPVGLRLLRRRMATMLTSVFGAVLTLIAGRVLAEWPSGSSDDPSLARERVIRQVQPFRAILELVDPSPPPPRWIVGMVAIVPPKPPTPRTTPPTGG
jgi:hypothetical protein